MKGTFLLVAMKNLSNIIKNYLYWTDEKTEVACAEGV
jgi:hypothetical protein